LRDLEEELLPYMRRRGLGLVAYWNLAAGFLSGKYRPGMREVSGSRSEEGWLFPYEHFHPQADEVLRSLLDEADKLAVNPAAMAIAWVKAKTGVTSTLVGARTLEQLKSSLEADRLELPEEVVERLDSVSELSARYPRWMEEGQTARREGAISIE